MHPDVWVWQPAQSAAPATSAAGRVFVKAFDGTTWQATYDHSDGAVDRADAIERLARFYGRQVIPWGVVQGRDPAAEGKLAGAVAAHSGGGVVIVDLEPAEGPNYWHGDAAAVRTFMQNALESGAREVYVAPDARAGRLAPCSFNAWVAEAKTTICMPQVYSSDFHKAQRGGARNVTVADAKADLDNALAQLAAEGWHTRATIAPIFAGDLAPEVLIAQIGYAHELGCARPSVYQRDNTPQDTVDALTAASDPWAPPATSPAMSPPLSQTRLAIERNRWVFGPSARLYPAPMRDGHYVYEVEADPAEFDPQRLPTGG